MPSDLSTIEADVLTVDSPERFLELRQRVDFAKSFIKAVDLLLDGKALEVVEKYGPITSGDWLYAIVSEHSYKAKQKPKEMAQGIMECLGGDWDAFSICLASGAFKHGQLRKLLDEAGISEKFDEFFERVEKKTVEGKPIKKVAAINKTFLAKAH